MEFKSLKYKQAKDLFKIILNSKIIRNAIA